jgi:hypothetical protein
MPGTAQENAVEKSGGKSLVVTQNPKLPIRLDMAMHLRLLIEFEFPDGHPGSR